MLGLAELTAFLAGHMNWQRGTCYESLLMAAMGLCDWGLTEGNDIGFPTQEASDESGVWFTGFS